MEELIDMFKEADLTDTTLVTTGYAYEDMHIYDQEVELNTDNYGSELTVSLEGEKIGIDYIDFDMYVREALPEYFKEDSSEEE